MTADFDGKGGVSNIQGNKCKRGETYIKSEILNPVRVLATIVKLEGGKTRMCPVRSSSAVPKDMIKEMAKVVSALKIPAPVRVGDVVVKNIMGTRADIVVTRDMD
jgi:CxxC motif-containing protein